MCVPIATSVLLPASITMQCPTNRGGFENRERTLLTIFFSGIEMLFCIFSIVSYHFVLPAIMSVTHSGSESFLPSAFSSVLLTAPPMTASFRSGLQVDTGAQFLPVLGMKAIPILQFTIGCFCRVAKIYSISITD